jgi:hypothetical protein
MMKTIKDTSLTGAAGEHLVLSRLLSKGHLAAQAPRGTRKADVLVNFLDGRRPCLIQVKARLSGRDLGWHMQEKHETQVEDDLFFCFVDFEPKQPDVYVLPSAVVAKAISTDHQIWLDTPGKSGQAHNPTKLRRLSDIARGKEQGWLSEYLERWDLIAPEIEE